MKNLYFDELLLEVSGNDILKGKYTTFSETGEVDEIYESKYEELNIPPGFDRAISVDLDELKKGKLKGPRLELLGDHLYRILFTGESHKRFEQALNEIDRHPGERGLRIIIAYSEDSIVAKWPLEVLHCPSPDVWLATDKRLSLSRKIIGGHYRPSDKTPPLRILVVVSSPRRKARVMLTKVLEELIEWAEKTSPKPPAEKPQQRARHPMSLAEEEGKRAPIEVQVLGQLAEFEPKGDQESRIYLNRQAGYNEFRKQVEDWKPQVLHFIGHGDVKGDEGRLAFVNPINGLADWITAKQLSQLIIPRGTLRLVMLQVCKSAADVQLSLASKMVSLNIPAVVAMQFEIQNYCAVEFVSHFYQRLAERKAVDYAVQLARYHITQVPNPDTKATPFWDNREFCTPVVYTIKPGTIIDTSLARKQLVPGGVTSAWSQTTVNAENMLKQYSADLEKYRSQGDLDMVALLQEKIDSLMITRPPSPQAAPPAGPI